MAHSPPPRQGIANMPDSINSALALEQSHQHPLDSPISPDSARATSAESSARKRKKAGENGEEAAPAEPRRLRRSHEACARCRSKKIKVRFGCSSSSVRTDFPSAFALHPSISQTSKTTNKLLTILHPVRLKASSLHCLPVCRRPVQPGR